MRAVDLLTGRRQFLSDSEIIDLIKTSKKYDDDLQSGAQRALLVFETSNQHTWLVMTEQRLYVTLDDVRRPKAKILWTTGRVPITVRISERSRPSVRTGIVHINERSRGLLFTKGLFLKISLEEKIKEITRDVRKATN